MRLKTRNTNRTPCRSSGSLILVRPLLGRVDDDLAVAVEREHVAALDAVDRAPVERDDLVLAGGQGVAVDRDDLAGDRRRRRVRRVVGVLARRHRREAIADAGFLADAGDREGRRDDLGLALGVGARLALHRVLGGADVGRLVAEHLLGRRVAQRARLAEDAELALRADLAAHVGGVAARQQHAAFLGGDDARRGGELVGLEDHRLVEERLDQVERDRGDAVEGDVARADRAATGSHRRRRRPARPCAGGARPFVLSRNSTWPGKIRCGIPDLLEVHAPELGPAPRALQVQLRDAPERVAALDGVDVGRVRQQLAQRDAGFGGLLRGRALLRRDREVGLGGERRGASIEPSPTTASCRSAGGAGRIRRLMQEVSWRRGERPRARSERSSARLAMPDVAVRRKSHLVSQILPIKH